MKNKVGLILNAGLTATRLYRGWLKQMGAADKVHVKLLDYEKINEAAQRTPLTGPGPLIAPLVAELKAQGCTHGAIGCFSLMDHAKELFKSAGIEDISGDDVLWDYVIEYDLELSGALGILGTLASRYLNIFGKENFHGTTVLWPDGFDHLDLDEAVHKRLAGGASPTGADYDIVTKCTADMIKRGATRIVVGCTDLGEACPKAYDGTLFIDLPFLHAKEIARVANE
jgi:aspartate/glutamate racemase